MVAALACQTAGAKEALDPRAENLPRWVLGLRAGDALEWNGYSKITAVCVLEMWLLVRKGIGVGGRANILGHNMCNTHIFWVQRRRVDAPLDVVYAVSMPRQNLG